MARKSNFLPPSARGRGLKRPLTPKARAYMAAQEALKAEAAPVSEPPPLPVVVPEPVAEVVVEAVVPEPVVEPERAHEEDGTFTADDPETPDVDEAFVGDAPKKLWSAKTLKPELRRFAAEAGIVLSEDATKAVILAALDAAGA